MDALHNNTKHKLQNQNNNIKRSRKSPNSKSYKKVKLIKGKIIHLNIVHIYTDVT